MLIQGGRVVDPAQQLDGVFDVRTEGARIREIGAHLTPNVDEECFDARNCFVSPGFIDMHVHLREPGFPDKETIATGCAAALAGGFTAVACMANTRPVMDMPETVRSVLATAAAAGLARVHPIAAVTRNRAGAELVDYRALHAAGAVAFSDDGDTIMNAKVLREAARAARDVPGCFISHCEDEHLKAQALVNEGSASTRLGVGGSPALAEDIIVARDLQIAADSGKPWHIAHVSTQGAVNTIEWMRACGVAATCEVTPHHLYFSDEAVDGRNGRSKVNPPLRAGADVAALVEAVRAGKIDAFASDHAPHTVAEKNESLRGAPVGFSGLEVALGAYALAVPGLPVTEFVRLCSTAPARILGVAGGALRIGEVADITVFAEREWRVDAAAFYSKGKCTPFDGLKLPRQAIATVVGGEFRMRGGKVAGS